MSNIQEQINHILAEALGYSDFNAYAAEGVSKATTDLLALIQEEALRIIGDNEPEPTRYGKRVPASGSVEAFQKFYRNKLRNEQREKAQALTNQKSEEKDNA